MAEANPYLDDVAALRERVAELELAIRAALDELVDLVGSPLTAIEILEAALA